MNRRITLPVFALAALAVLSLTSCAKMTEPFKDAPVSGRNTDPADLVTFPDGFSNIATKCDHSNRVYTVYHANSPYAALAVVPNDPTCNPAR